MMKPSKTVLAGWRHIDIEMTALADCKAGEDASGRKEAREIRAALEYLRHVLLERLFRGQDPSR